MDNVSFSFSVNKQKLTVFREALAVLLSKSICRIEFAKVDGTEKSMRCTLMEKFLPKISESKEDKKDRKQSLEVLPVFVLDNIPEKCGWRSFRIDSLKSIEVLYE